MISDQIKNFSQTADYEQFFVSQLNYYHRKVNKNRNKSTKKCNNLKLKQLPDIECPKLEDNWLVNFTDVDIPIDMKVLLSYGEKFSTYQKLDKINFQHLIADVENAISMTIEDENLRNVARADISNMIKSYVIRNGADPTGMERFYGDLEDKTMKFIRNYHENKEAKEFLITRSDKCNQTVVIYKEDYVQAMMRLIGDTSSYRELPKDITPRVMEEVKLVAKDMQSEGCISPQEYRNLTMTNAIAPRIYGLVKTHKSGITRDNLKLRPVVSYVGSALYNLAKYLGKIIRGSINSPFNISNSYELKQFLTDKKVPAGYVLVSMDVVSLFTCLPQEFLIECVEKKWGEISKRTNMSKELFIRAVRTCLGFSYFVFQGRYFDQITGSPMGSPFSTPICDLAMEVILEIVTDLLPFDVPFLVKYVDDLLLCCPENLLEETLEIFNAINRSVQFTMEVEVGNKLPYLDLLLIRNQDGTIATDFFRKPTASGRILNYNSNHSMRLKINTAAGSSGEFSTYRLSRPMMKSRLKSTKSSRKMATPRESQTSL
jgi:hypothetical protein